MRTRPVLPLAAVLLAGAVAAATAAPAQAGTPQRSGHFGYAHQAKKTHRAAADCTTDDGSGPTQLGSSATPDKLDVGISEVKTLVYEAEVTDPCGVADVTLRINYVDTSYDDVPLVFDHTQPEGEVWTRKIYADPAYLLNSDAGSLRQQVLAFDPFGNGTRKASAQWTVYRYAKLANNATPEPVKKNGTVTVSGGLVRADWEAGAYRGFTNQDVDLQFRTTNGTYETIGHATTGSGGKVKATAKATASGCYRLVFAGTSTTSAATGTGDCVTVK